MKKENRNNNEFIEDQIEGRNSVLELLKSERDINKIFIANFYKYGFAGVIENWIVTEMKESPENIIKKLDILISGNFEEAVRKMSN